MRSNACDMLDILADHRCAAAETCLTCSLFLSVPDSGTPAYAAWRSGIRRQLLTDQRILSLCPDVVVWLIDQEERTA